MTGFLVSAGVWVEADSVRPRPAARTGRAATSDPPLTVIYPPVGPPPQAPASRPAVLSRPGREYRSDVPQRSELEDVGHRLAWSNSGPTPTSSPAAPGRRGGRATTSPGDGPPRPDLNWHSVLTCTSAAPRYRPAAGHGDGGQVIDWHQLVPWVPLVACPATPAQRAGRELTSGERLLAQPDAVQLPIPAATFASGRPAPRPGSSAGELPDVSWLVVRLAGPAAFTALATAPVYPARPAAQSHSDATPLFRRADQLRLQVEYAAAVAPATRPAVLPAPGREVFSFVHPPAQAGLANVPWVPQQDFAAPSWRTPPAGRGVMSDVFAVSAGLIVVAGPMSAWAGCVFWAGATAGQAGME